MIKLLALAGALGLGFLTAPPPAMAAPLAFELDGSHTHIVWKVDRFGFTDTVGTFADVTGSLTLDEADPTASRVEATIRLSGLRSDLVEREDVVRGPKWLDAAQFPTIEFASTLVELIDEPGCEGRCANVTGNMTLKGVTAPLTIRVELNKSGPDPVTKKQAAGFSATGKVVRSEFGVNTALGLVGDEVTFEIEALAIAAG